MSKTLRLLEFVTHPFTVVLAAFGAGSMVGLLGPLGPVWAFVYANAGSIASVVGFLSFASGEGIIGLPTRPLTVLTLGFSGIVAWKAAQKVADKFEDRFNT